jgi:hypothetical protein
LDLSFEIGFRRFGFKAGAIKEFTSEVEDQLAVHFGCEGIERSGGRLGADGIGIRCAIDPGVHKYLLLSNTGYGEHGRQG